MPMSGLDWPILLNACLERTPCLSRPKWTDLVQLLILPVRPPVHPSPVLLGLPPFSAAARAYCFFASPFPYPFV
ncbi:hypothetical protein CPAR01_08376 [Colletotrichum paranaense]|uniref:Uncharacterized protein n=1 Tax=Colletotrichum paranaense TaxID=1914294 RepID=A0ABQ9SK53_9PEZI|nr:uncharacterized protein CPAR01_08376 [Colletotrichum paranaense]KAK1538263.1 hypothetical protein CPAR01_08376 [Colletotrichum paranaense]